MSETHIKPTTNGFFSKRIKSQIYRSETTSSSSPFNSTFSPNGFHFKTSLKRKLMDDFNDWSPSDKSLFRVFSTIYSDNICMIADLLDKPCTQVYQFYLNELKTSDFNSYLQREISTTSNSSTIGSFNAVMSTSSSDSGDVKINGERTNSNGHSNLDETLVNGHGNGKDETHLVESNISFCFLNLKFALNFFSSRTIIVHRHDVHIFHHFVDNAAIKIY